MPVSSIHQACPVTKKQLLSYIETHKPRTKDVALFLNCQLSVAKIRLASLESSGLICKKFEDSPWYLVSQKPELPVLYNTEEKTEQHILEYVGRNSPMTTDVADWMGPSYLYAAVRLEKLSKQGKISRVTRSHPWLLVPKEPDVTDRIKISRNNCGELDITVLPKKSIVYAV